MLHRQVLPARRAAAPEGLAEGQTVTLPAGTEEFEKCVDGHYVGYRTQPKVSHL
jgi:hypothetical protein